MVQPPVLLDIKDGIATLTLNRPEVNNAVNLDLAQGLADAVLRCETDGPARVVVLRGAGRMFCAGGDLKDFSTRQSDLTTYLHAVTTALHTAVSRLAHLPAPVIAAVHGSAAGGGMSLACACDLVVAAASSRFTLAYTRIGLTPDGSSSYVLPHLVGLRRALDLVLTNRVLTAHEAEAWGLVSEVVEDERLDARVAELAAQLAAGPPLALAEAKRLIRLGLSQSLETQMAEETRTIVRMARTDDAAEGIGAFLQKRTPRYSGK